MVSRKIGADQVNGLKFARFLSSSVTVSAISFGSAPERAVRHGLRKGVKDDPPEPDPSKKTTHWAKWKLKRDEWLITNWFWTRAKAKLNISEYVEPGPRDARKVQNTLDALIITLQDQALADAVARLERSKTDKSAKMLARGEDPTSLK
jgi:hypothetical protein